MRKAKSSLKRDALLHWVWPVTRAVGCQRLHLHLQSTRTRGIAIVGRGFFATLNRLAKEAERERRMAERNSLAAVRRAEQTRRAEERVFAQLERATEKERRRLEKEAAQAHLEAQLAEVEDRNARLEEVYKDIDSLLHATLDIDDFVDLESLKLAAEHPPFDRPDLEKPLQPPVRPQDPPRPLLRLPEEPSGFGKLLGRGKHEKAVEKAREDHAAALREWEAAKARIGSDYEAAHNAHRSKEEGRIRELEKERQRYKHECEAREAEAAARASEVDQLIADVGYGVPEAIEEYISIVLGNSVYPAHFQVSHEHAFDAGSAELRLTVRIPPPDSVPSVKEYKYAKAKDEIVSTSLSQKACRDRYAAAVHQVALRSFHEVYEADRRGLIQSISLVVGTEAMNPATGRPEFVPLAAAGAQRGSFLDLDLTQVVPLATLKRLGASISKNPYALEPADVGGVRRA